MDWNVLNTNLTVNVPKVSVIQFLTIYTYFLGTMVDHLNLKISWEDPAHPETIGWNLDVVLKLGRLINQAEIFGEVQILLGC